MSKPSLPCTHAERLGGISQLLQLTNVSGLFNGLFDLADLSQFGRMPVEIFTGPFLSHVDSYVTGSSRRVAGGKMPFIM